jgi:hypothetical protein
MQGHLSSHAWADPLAPLTPRHLLASWVLSPQTAARLVTSRPGRQPLPACRPRPCSQACLPAGYGEGWASHPACLLAGAAHHIQSLLGDGELLVGGDHQALR